METHTVLGEQVLGGVAFLQEGEGLHVVRSHHERWDGGGYPRGLTETQIPEVAQIVTVADSFDAITSDRPYRAAHSAAWAMEEIDRCAGSQFSPRVVEGLRALYHRGELAVDDEASRRAA
jgi:HD-GYP domain-containing protein (c-di-GMP phosphodiesterase class II)